MAQEFCPRCGMARTGSFRFCRSCQFDFEANPPVVQAAITPPPSAAPAPTSPPGPAAWATPATGAAGLNLAAVAVIIGGAIYAVAAFLPWVSMSAPLIGTVTRSGMEGGDGYIVVAIGAVLVLAGVQGFRGTVSARMRVLTMLVAAAALGLTALEYNNIRGVIDGIDADYRDLATVGLGVSAMAVGGVLALVGGARLGAAGGAIDGGKPIEPVSWAR